MLRPQPGRFFSIHTKENASNAPKDSCCGSQDRKGIQGIMLAAMVVLSNQFYRTVKLDFEKTVPENEFMDAFKLTLCNNLSSPGFIFSHLIVYMDCLDWLNDDKEFPCLNSTKEDNHKSVGSGQGNDTRTVSMIVDDDWQLIPSAAMTTYADMLKKIPSVCPGLPPRPSSYSIACDNRLNNALPITTNNVGKHNNGNNLDGDDADNDDDDGASTFSNLAILRKSKARSRYRGDAWIYQHRIRVLTSCGYAPFIQGVQCHLPYEANEIVPNLHGPVVPIIYHHFWRYVCKEDPMPEVDRRRKTLIRDLTKLTS